MRLRGSTRSISILLNMFIDLVTVTVESSNVEDNNNNDSCISEQSEDYSNNIINTNFSLSDNVSKSSTVNTAGVNINTVDVSNLTSINNCSHTTSVNSKDTERCKTN